MRRRLRVVIRFVVGSTFAKLALLGFLALAQKLDGPRGPVRLFKHNPLALLGFPRLGQRAVSVFVGFLGKPSSLGSQARQVILPRRALCHIFRRRRDSQPLALLVDFRACLAPASIQAILLFLGPRPRGGGGLEHTLGVLFGIAPKVKQAL